MRIPIENIYFLLCYAWDALDEKEVVDVESVDAESLADLFACVLTNGVNHLLRRGLDRGYLVHEEWTSRPRGRILMRDIVLKAASHTGRLPCAYDDLSHDVLHNRILKATMQRLLRTRNLAPKTAEPLARLLRLFGEVSDVHLSTRTFGEVQLHRNNRFYAFLLKVCELIHDEVFVLEDRGDASFVDFVRDERRMAGLYEDFVRRFYQVECPILEVKREHIHWRWIPKDEASKALLPRMETDVSIISPKGRLIIDCKYTPNATKAHFDAAKLRSEHIYQINAYMQNVTGPSSDSCDVMLLYPTVDTTISADYAHEGHTISIRTINLNQPHKAIARDLKDLVSALL